VIAEGMDADLCIFDADKIIDRATFKDCFEKVEGLNYVILDGKVVVEDGVYNGIRAGRVVLQK
jgi:N-acyl-D-amino-acid deacylase